MILLTACYGKVMLTTNNRFASISRSSSRNTRPSETIVRILLHYWQLFFQHFYWLDSSGLSGLFSCLYKEKGKQEKFSVTLIGAENRWRLVRQDILCILKHNFTVAPWPFIQSPVILLCSLVQMLTNGGYSVWFLPSAYWASCFISWHLISFHAHKIIARKVHISQMEKLSV